MSEYWTLGRSARFAACLTAMALAPYDLWRGKYVLAVLMLILAKVIMEWERSIQTREGRR